MTKIYSKGSYFIVELPGGPKPLQDGKGSVNVEPMANDGLNFVIESPRIGRHEIALAEMVDEASVGYDATTWADFYQANSSFNPATTASVAAVAQDLADFEAEKGQPNGLASLDGSGLLPASQLPISAMEYKGNYNIVTNTPTLVDGTGNAGDVYKNTVAGSRDFGSGSLTVAIGDWLIYSGTIWEQTPASDLYELKSNKDTAEGYVGLTGFKIKFRNLLDSFTSFLTNSNTAVRTYLFQDRDGTIADDTDITSAKARANHTGTQTASTISDFDTEVANETNVSANTTHRTSDGSDHSFIDQDVTIGSSPTFDGSNITGVPSASTDTLKIDVRNSAGALVAKGQAVYISGYHVGSNNPEVSNADADLGGAYPAIGLVSADIANNANGTVIANGQINGIDTSAWTVGDNIYISTDPLTTLGLTNVKPTGTAVIQKIGEVLRSHATLGVLQVTGPARVNDIPNIPNGQFWVGNGSAVPTPVSMSGDVTMTNAGVASVAKVTNATDISIGGTIHASAVFEAESTTKGVLKPRMTTAQRDSISTPATGLEIYNTDRSANEWYDGQVWLNSNLVKRQNKSGGAVVEGNPVIHDSASEDGVKTTNVSGQIAVFGVVVDGDLTADGWLTVAVGGDYNVLMNGTVTRNQLVTNSTTTGEALGTSSGTTGAFAITKQERSGAGSSLVKSWIHKMDTF